MVGCLSRFALLHYASRARVSLIMLIVVSGIEKGRGQGASKQIAKEAAAKQAYINMGWGGYGTYGKAQEYTLWRADTLYFVVP